MNSDPNLRLSCFQRRFAPAGADGEHGALVQDEADALLHKHTRTVQDCVRALDAKRRLVCGVVTTCAVVTPWLRATLASALLLQGQPCSEHGMGSMGPTKDPYKYMEVE